MRRTLPQPAWRRNFRFQLIFGAKFQRRTAVLENASYDLAVPEAGAWSGFSWPAHTRVTCRDEFSQRCDLNQATWYFDLISPFAYLHFKQLHKLPASLEIEYVPVLFAGLLKHCGQKGPAEIPAKRIYTYRYVTWRAQSLGVPFRMPPSHPFNSLYALRLLVGAGPNRANVTTAFDMIWREGRDLQDPEQIVELGRRLGLKDVRATLADAEIKSQLRANTDTAISKGVFGVPTFLVGEALFWGQDSQRMMQDYLRDPGLFNTLDMQRVSNLPVGTARREVS